jgi:hypothetical protein
VAYPYFWVDLAIKLNLIPFSFVTIVWSQIIAADIKEISL